MAQQNQIVGLVDASAYAASVCAHAAWVARRAGAPVMLVHVLGGRDAPAVQDHSGAISLGARTALLDQLATLDAQRARLLGQQGRAILDDARALVAGEGVAEVTTRLRHGDVVEALAEIEPDARLIVIGKRGEAANFATGHLGANLERIVRASHRPVLVAARAFRPIARVLLAFDGGPSALRAVDLVAASPVFAGLSVQLTVVGAAPEALRRTLDAARDRLLAAGIEATAAVLDGQPEAVLAGLTDAGAFDLLVMGAYGHSRIRSLMVGSTTTAMVRSCKVPVVLIR